MAGKKKPSRRRQKPNLGPQSPDRSDSALRAHFKRSGILFGITQDAIAQRLRRLLGQVRFEQWQEVNLAKMHGGTPIKEYDLMQTPEEMTTLFSLQADVSLAIAEWLDHAVESVSASSNRILDLGCGSGIISSWLAAKYPTSEIIGCDSHQGMLRAAFASHNLPNLRFAKWDYCNAPDQAIGRFNTLLTSFGIDFPTGRSERESLIIGKIKEGERYRRMRDFLAPYFANWRLAANDDAVLFTALRIAEESTFLGAVDAAHEAGWVFEVDKYKAVICGNERFAGMTFKASSGMKEPLSERRVRAAWIDSYLSEQCATPWRDSVAMCIFESLSDKEIIKESSNTYSDGHTMRATVGRTPFFAFQFTHATTGFARLLFLPLLQANSVEPQFEWFDVMEFDGSWSF